MTNEELTIVVSREEDGRFLAEVVERPGVLAYGLTPNDAVRRAQVLVLKLESERLQRSSDPILGIEFAIEPAA